MGRGSAACVGTCRICLLGIEYPTSIGGIAVRGGAGFNFCTKILVGFGEAGGDVVGGVMVCR